MTRNELLKRKRFPRWLVGLMLVGSAFGGVACEGNVEGGGRGENGEGVDADVDVDADTEGGEGEGEGEGD